jgi:NDP-sugar pyrophosphorylase family protein
MAPVAGVPFLQLLLENLVSQGIGDVVLGTGYMAEQIESFFGNGADLGLRVRYSREDKPLGTGGALKLAAPMLSDPGVVIKGDSYVNWSLAEAADFSERRTRTLSSYCKLCRM